MPRKIEVRSSGGEWWPSESTPETLTSSGQKWRYVGGVLEYMNNAGQWVPVGDESQSMTVDEAMHAMRHVNARYRLRPYDDATVPTCQHPLTILDTGRCTRCGLKVHAPGNSTQRYDDAARSVASVLGGASTDQRTKEARAISGMEQWLLDAKRCSVPSCHQFAVWQQPDKNASDGMVYMCAEHHVNVRESVKALVDQSVVNIAKLETERANRLSDECGTLRAERDELLRENAVLRRKCEKLERKR